MKKKWTCLMLFAWLVVSSSGQSLISSGNILAGARQELVLDLHRQQMTYIQQTSRNLPFIDQISLRTETDRFEFSRQEYLARVTVNSLNEIHKMRLLQDSKFSAKEVMQRVYWHEALAERYEAVVSYRHLLGKLSVLQEFRVVFEDKLMVLKKRAALNAGADVDDLIKTEFALDELILKISESDALLAQWNQSIQIMTPGVSGNWRLDTSDFITPAQIEMIVAGIPDSVILNPHVAEKQARIDQINAAFKFEKARSNQILDFFQVRYSNRPFAEVNRELSLGIALNLPFKGSSRVNMSELTIDKNAAGQNIQLYMTELTRQLASSKLQVEALGRRFRLAHQQWLDSQARFTLEHSSYAEMEDPMTLLNAREIQLKRQMTLLDIEQEILEEYINILDSTGRLSEEPPVNYLSNDLDTY